MANQERFCYVRKNYMMDWLHMPPLTALRAFAALAETGSAVSAGASLNVSHAAISQQIKALETQMGVALVDRSGRKMALTREGRQLADALDEGFGTIADVVAALTGADADRPLQITATPQFASSWLMPRLGDFQARYPDIDLMINPSPQRVNPSPGGIDVALRFGAGRWDGLESELLIATDIVVTAAPALVGTRRFTEPVQLLDYPWLDELGATQSRDWLSRAGVTERRDKAVLQVPGNLMLDGVRAGQGIAVMAMTSVDRDVANGRLRVLFRDEDETGYFIVTRPGVMRPQARAFVSWLRTQRPTA